MNDERPLPYGWIKEYDQNYQQYYYVDTKATPPRSIWHHPFEDEQYLREHPDAREKASSSRYPPPDSRPIESRPAQSSSTPIADPTRNSSDRPRNKEKKSFLGKLKDKAIGTKEEREAARLAEQRMIEERRRRAMAAQQQRQQAYAQQQQYGYGPPQGYGGGYYPQQGGYPQQYPQSRRTGRSGAGSLAMPILGGLAGGLLLGEALDGFDGGDGGDFGGDGGDFGGGDFGGDF